MAGFVSFSTDLRLTDRVLLSFAAEGEEISLFPTVLV